MTSVAEWLEQARTEIDRVAASDVPDRVADGAWLIDLRPIGRRESDGHVPGAIVIDRLVLEWRLDPDSPYRMSPAPERGDEVILLCNEGYASSLAARDLRTLGFERTADVIDGFAGWRAAGLPIADRPTRQVA